MEKAVVHFEIGCSELVETVDFYRQIFDWNISVRGTSATIDTGREDAIPGHINKLGPDEPQNYINLYIETDTIDSDLAMIESKGGQKLVGPIQLADGRDFAWFKDLAGNTLGLITPLKK